MMFLVGEGGSFWRRWCVDDHLKAFKPAGSVASKSVLRTDIDGGVFWPFTFCQRAELIHWIGTEEDVVTGKIDTIGLCRKSVNTGRKAARIHGTWQDGLGCFVTQHANAQRARISIE